MRGWGLKNPIIFAKSLATKGIWRLIKHEGIWERLIYQKYIYPPIVDEWFRYIEKYCKNVYASWGTLLNDFDLIGEWMI